MESEALCFHDILERESVCVCYRSEMERFHFVLVVMIAEEGKAKKIRNRGEIQFGGLEV